MRVSGRIGRDCPPNSRVQIALTGQGLSRPGTKPNSLSPGKGRPLRGESLLLNAGKHAVDSAQISNGHSPSSSAEQSPERLPSMRASAPFAFAPTSAAPRHIQKFTNYPFPQTEHQKACQRCSLPESMCFDCYSKLPKRGFRKSSATQRRQATLRLHAPILKQRKTYLGDLDLSSIKQKLAHLHLKWPEHYENITQRRSVLPSKASHKLLKASAETSATSSSSSRLLPKSESKKPLSPASLSPARRSLPFNSRDSARLKPITASQCKHYAVDLQICHECSSQELQRVMALRQLSEKISQEASAGSILKHKVEFSAAPWVGDSNDSPVTKGRCVRFGDISE